MKHLEYTKTARNIRDGKTKPSLAVLTYPEANSKKEAYGICCLSLEIAKRCGEHIPKERIESFYNKIKGRNSGASQKEISHIFQEAARLIPGRTMNGLSIRRNLEQRSNKNMTKVVAETVLETLLPPGSSNTITHNQTGWQQLAVAILVVLGIKFFRGK